MDSSAAAEVPDVPVVEVQQDQAGVDPVLVKLQVDLAAQLGAPGGSEPRLVATLITPPASPSGSSAASARGEAASPAGSRPGTAALVAAAVAASVEPPAAPAPAPAAPARAPAQPGSLLSDEEWHLVSPAGSLHGMRGSSSRCSFEDAGAGSSPGSPGGSPASATPKEQLAESILAHPVLLAAAQQAANAEAAAAVAADAGAELPAAAAGAEECEAPAAGAGGLRDEVSLAACSAEALQLLTSSVACGAAGLREWLLESLAALVQTGRDSQAAAVSGYKSAVRSLQLAAKQGGLAAAAVTAAADWRVVLSSAAAVVCLAMWLKSRKEASALRGMLRRRDHELSKLVMRVVSLQELLNQGSSLPLARYSARYEVATTGFM